jgi:hypothetical protein
VPSSRTVPSTPRANGSYDSLTITSADWRERPSAPAAAPGLIQVELDSGETMPDGKQGPSGTNIGYEDA